MKTLVRGIYTFDILNFTPFKTHKTHINITFLKTFLLPSEEYFHYVLRS